MKTKAQHKDSTFVDRLIENTCQRGFLGISEDNL